MDYQKLPHFYILFSCVDGKFAIHLVLYDDENLRNANINKML